MMTLTSRYVQITSLLWATTLASGDDDKMHCGENVPFCGILVIESGLGEGGYHQKKPGVHGLWPQVSPYGDSDCVRPADTADPSKIYECYKPDDDGASGTLWFEQHEWEKHGTCSGAASADDFFTQVCSLAAKPMDIMGGIKEAGGDLDGMVSALEDQGFPVYYKDTWYQQVELSVCASNDGRWMLSTVADFSVNCKGTKLCTATCDGYSCDGWYDYNSVTCSYLESRYGCDCSGCVCAGDWQGTSAMVQWDLLKLRGLAAALGFIVAVPVAFAVITVYRKTWHERPENYQYLQDGL